MRHDDERLTTEIMFKCHLGSREGSNIPKRVKQLCIIPNLIDPNDDASSLWFASVDGSGILSLWYWDMSDSGHLGRIIEPLLSQDTDARVTSMDCNNPSRVAVQ